MREIICQELVSDSKRRRVSEVRVLSASIDAVALDVIINSHHPTSHQQMPEEAKTSDFRLLPVKSAEIRRRNRKSGNPEIRNDYNNSTAVNLPLKKSSSSEL